MSQESLLDFWGTQTRIIGDLIEPWKAEHELATTSHIFEKLCPSLVLGCERLQLALPALKRSLFQRHRDESVLALGTKYYQFYKDQLEICESAASIARDVVEEGFALPSLPRLEIAIRELAAFIEGEVDQLPRIRPEILAISSEQYERGEYQSAREFLDELRRRAD